MRPRARGRSQVSEPAGVGYVEVRAYAELNDFLAPELRGASVRRPFRPHQTVKDVLEAMGIPHTEIDLILVNGAPADFDHRPTAGDRIAAYPMFEALDVGSTARLRPVPLRDPRFVVDVNLGRLARLLRILGLDVWWSSDADDATLARHQPGRAANPADPRPRPVEAPGHHARSIRPLSGSRGTGARGDKTTGPRPTAGAAHPVPALQRHTGRGRQTRSDRPARAVDSPATTRNSAAAQNAGAIYWAGSHHAKLLSLVERLRGQL